jgi:hypothetical protein
MAFIDDLPGRDVVYDNKQHRWACCGMVNGVRKCDNPTKEFFDAAAPGSLPTYFVIGAAPDSHPTLPEQKITVSVTPTPSSTSISKPIGTAMPNSRESKPNPESKMSGAVAAG